MYGNDSKDQMLFAQESSIRLVEFEAWWQGIGIQELQITIEQHVIHFRYPKMHRVSHITESIWQMGCGDNVTTDISERRHVGNVKEAYWSTHKASYIQQRLKHNDWCTGPDYVEETLSYLALQGWHDIDSEKVFNLLSAADERQTTGRAHHSRLRHCLEEPSFRPVSQRGQHFRETHVRGVCRSNKLTSLRDASVDFGIPNFGLLCHTPIEHDWWHQVSGLVLWYDQNVLIDSISSELQNGLLYYSQPFHGPASVKRLASDCKVEYTDANQGIIPWYHDIWVQYMHSDLNNIFQGDVPTFPVS